MVVTVGGSATRGSAKTAMADSGARSQAICQTERETGAEVELERSHLHLTSETLIVGVGSTPANDAVGGDGAGPRGSWRPIVLFSTRQ